MIPTSPSSTPLLREAYYELSLEKHVPDADLLDDVVRRYPQFAGELTNFAIELAVDALHNEIGANAAESTVDLSHISPVVSRAMSRFQNRLHSERQKRGPAAPLAFSSEPASNPFASLTREEFRAFARRIGANTVFVSKLRDRQIEPETFSQGFQQLVADELTAPLEVVIAHLSATSGTSSVQQFFKAEGKPNLTQRQSFEDAVRSSGLSEEQQQRLLRF